MGLYDEVPQSFAGQNEQRLSQAANSAPGLYRSYLQDQGIKQQNVDAAYNSPARMASPHEAHIGNYVQKLFGDAPPEWEQRFRAEMQPQYVTPSGPESGDHMTEPAYMGGYGLSAQPQTPAYQAQPQQRQGLQAPTSQMTQGDVQKYMSMAPLVQAENRQRKLDNQPAPRDYLGEIALRATLKGDEDRKTEGTKQEGRMGKQDDQQDWAAKEAELTRAHQWRIALLKNDAAMAAIEARIRTGVTNAWEIAQLRSDTQIVAAAMAAQSREMSSIPNLADDPKLKKDSENLEARLKQAQLNIEKLKAKGPSNQPTGSASTRQTASASSTKNQPGQTVDRPKVPAIDENGNPVKVFADKLDAYLKANPKRRKR